VSDNDPFQPQSAVSQDQGSKRSFRRWRIAAVVVLIIIASIGEFYLHQNSTYPHQNSTYPHQNSTYPTLRASYKGYVGTNTCNPYAVYWTGTISLEQVVEDHTHGTFTGQISENDGCSACGGAASGTVTPSGNVSFTCATYVDFSGTIQSNGGIDGQYYYHGTVLAGNFCLNACSI
jgi:hypothetical protein